MIHGLDNSLMTECRFMPINVQTESRLLSGAVQSLTLGPGYWQVDIRFDTPTRSSFAALDAFVTARRGPRFPFLLSRKGAARPRVGPVSDEGIILSGIDKQYSTIALSNVGNWIAAAGDMISYRTAAGGFYIGEVVANAQSVAGAITIPVWPVPSTAGQVPAVRRNFAAGEFYISGRLGKTEDAIRARNYIEFKAQQLIRTDEGPSSPFADPEKDIAPEISEVVRL